MDSLRLILLVGGIFLLAGIYFWGVTVARRESRSEKNVGADAEITDELELLERVQDARAALNAESLKELQNYDIDEGLNRETISGTATESAIESAAKDDYAESPPPPDDDHDHDEGRFRPVFAKELAESADSGEELSEMDEVVATLSEIRATLAPDPLINVDQLDLLPEENEAQRAEARVQREESKAKSGETKDPSAESLVLTLTVMAKEGQRFPGEELRNWLEALKLRHGDMGIFHYRPAGKPMRAPPTFSVASVVKPGSFDLEEMAHISIPGVAMFLQLPGPDEPSAAFEEMLRTARKLADGLGGVVCDETRSTLTGQAINHLRERIAEFSRRQRLRF